MAERFPPALIDMPASSPLNTQKHTQKLLAILEALNFFNAGLEQFSQLTYVDLAWVSWLLFSW
jgi:hypothetical protein